MMSENETIPVATAVYEGTPEGVEKPPVSTAVKAEVTNKPRMTNLQLLTGLVPFLAGVSAVVYALILFFSHPITRVISSTQFQFVGRWESLFSPNSFIFLAGFALLAVGLTLWGIRSTVVSMMILLVVAVLNLVILFGTEVQESEQSYQQRAWAYSQLGVSEEQVVNITSSIKAYEITSEKPVKIDLTNGESLVYKVNYDDKTGYMTVKELSHTKAIPVE